MHSSNSSSGLSNVDFRRVRDYTRASEAAFQTLDSGDFAIRVELTVARIGSGFR